METAAEKTWLEISRQETLEVSLHTQKLLSHTKTYTLAQVYAAALFS